MSQLLFQVLCSEHRHNFNSCEAYIVVGWRWRRTRQTNKYIELSIILSNLQKHEAGLRGLVREPRKVGVDPGKSSCIRYSKSPTYERVLFQECVHKPSLFVSSTKLARYPTNTIGYIVLFCNRFLIPITTAFTLVSGHPGLEIKMLYYCTLYSTVQ